MKLINSAVALELKDIYSLEDFIEKGFLNKRFEPVVRNVLDMNPDYPVDVLLQDTGILKHKDILDIFNIDSKEKDLLDIPTQNLMEFLTLKEMLTNLLILSYIDNKIIIIVPHSRGKEMTIRDKRLISDKLTPKNIKMDKVYIKDCSHNTFLELLEKCGYEKPMPEITNANKVKIIFTEAVVKKATDIFIDSKPDGIQIKLGIFKDTINWRYLKKNAKHPMDNSNGFINGIFESEIAVKSNEATSGEAVQDREIKNFGEHEDHQGRVNLVTDDTGSSFVIRIHDKNKKAIPLDILSLSPSRKEELKRIINEPHGIMILAGATGNGKTTTIYSLLDEIKKKRKFDRIETVENPIEVRIDDISQISIAENSKLDYSGMMKALTRRNPKIIMLGEINYEEPARFAVNVALQSLFVISTIHSIDIPHVPARYKMLLEGNELVYKEFLSMVKGFHHQTMHRRLCSHCRESVKVSNTPMEIVSVLKEKCNIVLDQSKTLYKASENGCPECDYLGYDLSNPIILSETLFVTEEYRLRLINTNDIVKELREILLSKKMTELHDALPFMYEGRLSYEDIFREYGVGNH